MDALAKQEKLTLLRLARRSIMRYVQEGRREIEFTSSSQLQKPCGTFVTLHLEGELRGCIGRVRSMEPLERVVQVTAVAAATQDPRFHAVQPEELGRLEIEISVLSVPRVIKSFEEIQVGRDGLIITEGAATGLLLPQVATEQGWDTETFLGHTCLKAGLAPDHWRMEDPKIEIFSAQVFSEKELCDDSI